MIRLSGSQGANPWASIASSGDRHRTQQEFPVATETLQHEGLLEDMIYVIMRDYCGHPAIEGCYLSKQKAQLRLAVLRAEEDLALARAREEHPDDDLDHNTFGSTCYWLEDEKLIR